MHLSHLKRGISQGYTDRNPLLQDLLSDFTD